MKRVQIDDWSDFDPTVPLVFIFGCAVGAFIFWVIAMGWGWV